jgi:hypothetical protein
MFKKKGGFSLRNPVAGISIFFDRTDGGETSNEFIESLLMKQYNAQRESFDSLRKGSTWAVTNVDVPKLL